MNVTLDGATGSAPSEPGGIDHDIPGTVFDVTAVYLGLLTFFGIFNNGLVLVLYARNKTLQNPVNLFLINICLGDMSVSIFGTPFTLAANVARRWLFGTGGCIWYAFIVTVCGTEQIVSLAAVSIHRCCLVVRPFTAQKMTTRLALVFIAMTWVYSLIVSLPPAFGWNSYVLEGTETACSVDWTSTDPGDSSYIIFIFVMVLVIPLSLIVGSYTLLLYAVKKIASSEAARSSQHKADKKVTILVVVMIACFLIAWTPYSVFSLYVAANKNHSVSPVAASIPAMFAKSCTVYNPIIYFLLNKQFKDAFVEMMCCGRNPLGRGDDTDDTVRGRAPRQVNPAPGDSAGTGGSNRHDQQEDKSFVTQMSDIGATPALPRHPVKIADWGARSSKDVQPQPATEGEAARPTQKGVTETPVEAFKVEEELPSEPQAAKKETVKKHSRGFHKSSKVGPIEQPDDEKA